MKPFTNTDQRGSSNICVKRNLNRHKNSYGSNHGTFIMNEVIINNWVKKKVFSMNNHRSDEPSEYYFVTRFLYIEKKKKKRQLSVKTKFVFWILQLQHFMSTTHLINLP